MPTPVSAGSGATSRSIDAPELEPPPAPPAVVTLEPVVIEGDAGARKLVAQHDAPSARGDCLPQTRDATTSSIALIAGTLGTAATIASGGAGLLIAGCLVGLFGLSIDAGAKVHDLQECEEG